ncbi:MAG TPA: AzlD domain-containing protein [Acidimicrobiia bacterium]|nr:AzlD domain-containing protein [Acidimicrobiia bacterium]
MNDLALVMGVAAITFASRVVFLLKPRSAPGGRVGRFLEVFPLALFIAIATSGLVAPWGSPELKANLAGAVGGVVGGVVFRRSLWGVLGVGAACFYLARAIIG